ncbi:MAG TPA: hypothetical protein VNQ56_18870 [Pseudolabrys sp.]|nr:hypothetical protein [Pseudolabrys sp.]
MTVLLSALALFAIAFAAHLVWWRLCLPRRQLLILFGIIVVGACGGALLLVFDPLSLGLSVPLALLSVLLYGSFGVVYLILFSALEADSPTLTILNLIASRGQAGIHQDELVREMEKHSYVQVRIDQMVRDGMALESAGRIRLASGGLWFSHFILFYRRLLSREYVGG